MGQGKLSQIANYWAGGFANEAKANFCSRARTGFVFASEASVQESRKIPLAVHRASP
jgi:hypothetical protein